MFLGFGDDDDTYRPHPFSNYVALTEMSNWNSGLRLLPLQVQEALRLFVSPPDDARWKDASDHLVGALLNKVDTLCGLAVSG